MERATYPRSRLILGAGAAVVALASSMLVTVSARSDELGTTQIVSVANDGTLGDNDSLARSISADGRYVVFVSDADNLVSGDTNEVVGVFVRDTQTGTTTRVNVASDGTQAEEGSIQPSISADGRYVAFYSYASNLVEGDTNGASDIFVHDRETGTTSRVSVTDDGAQSDSHSGYAVISADGRQVAFTSVAGNLVEGDTNGLNDVFVRDLVAGTTTRENVASDGTQSDDFSHGVAISDDGRYVSFSSVAGNLVEGDTNALNDLFVRDTLAGTTSRISVASDGTQGDAMIGSRFSFSADGRYVAFGSYAGNLVTDDTNESADVFVRDTRMGTTTRMSLANTGAQGNGPSGDASINADGRYITFNSSADNLVAGDTNGEADVFVRDAQLGTTTRISVAGTGAQADSGSGSPSISADGRYVAFTSVARNLVTGDTNKVPDVFLRSLMVCADGMDNDGDGLMDHPADPGCESATDISEARVLRFDTSTAFHYRASSFKGRVSSDNKRCLGKRKVVLRKGNERRVGRTTTDRDGRWSISKPRPKGRYYATVKAQAKHTQYLDTIVCHVVKTTVLSARAASGASLVGGQGEASAAGKRN